MEAIINLIIQAIAGVAGGNAVGAGMKNASLGGPGNAIAGAIGGCQRRSKSFAAFEHL